METVDSWMAILRDSVGTEKITDLQLSVAMVIQHNALSLLRDCQKTLGLFNVVFHLINDINYL